MSTDPWHSDKNNLAVSNDGFAVLSLNLRFGLADDGSNGWEFRRAIFPQLLRSYPADFFCFQEANDFQIEFLNDLLKDYKLIGQRHPAPPSWQHNVIYYHKKWQCRYRDHFYLSPTPDIPSRWEKSKWPRQCTVGRFDANYREVICINTHFDFDEDVQVKSARTILERLTRVPGDTATVLAGDFNAPPLSGGYNVFTKQKSAGIPFKDCFMKPWAGTYHGFTGQPEDGQIDWILYRGRLIPQHARIIRDAINGRFPSDHFPLYAEFRWPPERGEPLRPEAE
jgi:endonuclease/exonuclease/phosphatase family metal-dependent hydrolase